MYKAIIVFIICLIATIIYLIYGYSNSLEDYENDDTMMWVGNSTYISEQDNHRCSQ